MRAMILAAGEGTRLSPLTNHLPKPMVPVVNRPAMEHIVRLLASHGFDEIMVNLHHLADHISGYFGDGSRFGVRITYSQEERLAGTAGGVKRVESFFAADTFLVIGGDDLADFDLCRLLEFHREHRSLATIGLYQVDDPSRFGVVAQDGGGRITAFQEKPAPGAEISRLANTQVYLLEPQVLDLIPAGEFVDFARHTFPMISEKGLPFYGCQATGYWRDIGSLRDYLQAHLDALEGRVELDIPGAALAPGIWVGEGCEINSQADLQPPLVIGSNCVVERRARLGPAAVIGNSCRIAPGATVERSVLWDGVDLDPGAAIANRIVTPVCQVEVP